MSVYFIRDALSGLVKIGTAGNPWARFGKIQSDCPGELTLLAVIDGGAGEEAALHARFAAYRVRGEWFRQGASLRGYLAQLPVPLRPTYHRSRWGDSGLRDTDLAERVGISRGMLSKIRSGQRVAGVPAAIRIFRATGVKVAPLDRLQDDEIDSLEGLWPANSRRRAA